MQNTTETWPPPGTSAARREPQNGQAWQNLGTVYSSSGLFAEAVESFNQAMAVRTGDLSWILANLAAAYQKMGLLELAESCLLDALAEEPGNDAFLGQLEGLQNQMGRKAEKFGPY